MTSSSTQDEEERRVEEETRKILEYEDQRTLSTCIWSYVKSTLKEVNILIEPDLRRQDGPPKMPDLLVNLDVDWLLIDVKRIATRSHTTLGRYVDEMLEYDNIYSFEGQSIHPTTALLCPSSIAEEFAKIKCPVAVMGYSIDEVITIETIVKGAIKDPLTRFCSGVSKIPNKPSLLSQYRFLRSEPPSTYTAEIVYSNLWPQRTVYNRDVFTVSRKRVLESLRLLYPPYLVSRTGTSIEQLTEGALSKALHFLETLGYIEVENDEVVVFASKGKRMGDLRQRFIREKAEMETKASGRKGRGRPPKRIPPKSRSRRDQSSLGTFINRWPARESASA